MKKFLLSFSFSILFITILVGQKTVTGVVVDEIDYEIAVHAEEGTHPFDLGLSPSKFAYKG